MHPQQRDLHDLSLLSPNRRPLDAPGFAVTALIPGVVSKGTPTTTTTPMFCLSKL